MRHAVNTDPIQHAITEIAIAAALAAVSVLVGVVVPIAGYLIAKGFGF